MLKPTKHAIQYVLPRINFASHAIFRLKTAVKPNEQKIWALIIGPNIFSLTIHVFPRNGGSLPTSASGTKKTWKRNLWTSFLRKCNNRIFIYSSQLFVFICLSITAVKMCGILIMPESPCRPSQGKGRRVRLSGPSRWATSLRTESGYVGERGKGMGPSR